MNIEEGELITIGDNPEPYLRASVLAKWLEYEDTDAVSQIYRRRKDDFNDGDIVIDKAGKMWLNYNGALKICIFSSQPRAKLARDEVVRVYKSWRKGELTSYEEMTPSQQAYNLARSVMTLAEEQMKQEKIIKKHEEKIQGMDKRIKQIEAKQNNGFISEDQKAQITVMVRELGQLLSSQTGHSAYGIVYTKMYEEFGISSYKNIPSDVFPRVIDWLVRIKTDVIKKLN